MKQKIVLLLALTGATISFSQNEYLDYKYALSTNVLFTHDYGQTTGLYEKSSLVSGITSSFFIMDKVKNQHEISLEKFRIGSSDYYYDSISLQADRSVDISLGYKYHLNLIKRKTSKWIPSIGLGAHAFYRSANFDSTTSLFFPVSYRGGGVRLIVQPTLVYHINHRVYLNLSLPVNIAHLELRSDRMDSPVIPAEQRKITRTDIVSFSQLQAKFGVGIKF